MSSSRAREPSSPEAILSGGQPGPVVARDRAGNTEAACRHKTMRTEMETEVAARHSIGCPARRGPGLSGLAIASAKSQAIGQNVDLEAPDDRSRSPSAGGLTKLAIRLRGLSGSRRLRRTPLPSRRP